MASGHTCSTAQPGVNSIDEKHRALHLPRAFAILSPGTDATWVFSFWCISSQPQLVTQGASQESSPQGSGDMDVNSAPATQG